MAVDDAEKSINVDVESYNLHFEHFTTVAPDIRDCEQGLEHVF